MARGRILLTLAALAVGLLVLNSALTPEAGAWTIYGTISKESGGDADSMLACYQKIPGPGSCGLALYWGDLVWKYAISDLEDGSYDVWAEYDDEFYYCHSQIYHVDIDGADVELHMVIRENDARLSHRPCYCGRRLGSSLTCPASLQKGVGTAVSTVLKTAAVVSLLSDVFGDTAGQSPGVSTPPLVPSAQIVPGTTAFCEVNGPVSKMLVGTRFSTV